MRVSLYKMPYISTVLVSLYKMPYSIYDWWDYPGKGEGYMWGRISYLFNGFCEHGIWICIFISILLNMSWRLSGTQWFMQATGGEVEQAVPASWARQRCPGRRAIPETRTCIRTCIRAACVPPGRVMDPEGYVDHTEGYVEEVEGYVDDTEGYVEEAEGLLARGWQHAPFGSIFVWKTFSKLL